VGGLLARHKHGAKGGAHAGGAVDLRQLHALGGGGEGVCNEGSGFKSHPGGCVVGTDRTHTHAGRYPSAP
jgi:hypothetical protein